MGNLVTTGLITKGLYGGKATKGLIVNQFSIFFINDIITTPTVIIGGSSLISNGNEVAVTNKIFNSKMFTDNNLVHFTYENKTHYINVINDDASPPNFSIKIQTDDIIKFNYNTMIYENNELISSAIFLNNNNE